VSEDCVELEGVSMDFWEQLPFADKKTVLTHLLRSRGFSPCSIEVVEHALYDQDKEPEGDTDKSDHQRSILADAVFQGCINEMVLDAIMRFLGKDTLDTYSHLERFEQAE